MRIADRGLRNADIGIERRSLVRTENFSRSSAFLFRNPHFFNVRIRPLIVQLVPGALQQFLLFKQDRFDAVLYLKEFNHMSHSVLLVIDVQDTFKADATRWSRRNNPKFESNVSALISAYREAGEPIIFFLHQDSDPGWGPGPNYRLMDFLDVRPDDVVLHKTTRSCFTSTDLQRRLNSLSAPRLVITGIQTEQCCETTTRDGGDLGYEVDFVTEATLTFPIQHWAGGPELSPELTTERTEYALARRFARIRTVNEVVADLPAINRIPSLQSS
jgi:nicotinamidase-related amidase